jgi:ribosomal protein S18 acetylase RimI-like enzyme
VDITIRPYRPSDQRALFDLSANTAFFGEPVEAFLEDRSLYNDAFARYYTEYETAYAWIADGAGEVAGFLLGCIDTVRQTRHWRSYLLKRVLVRAISGRYKLGRRTATFAWSMLMGMVRTEQPAVNLSEYPAHLQIDVKESLRGKGIGNRLIDTYLEQLRQHTVCGVHLETTSHNEAAWHLYEKIGFQLLDHRPNHYWSSVFGFEIQNLSYGLTLR